VSTSIKKSASIGWFGRRSVFFFGLGCVVFVHPYLRLARLLAVSPPLPSLCLTTTTCLQTTMTKKRRNGGHAIRRNARGHSDMLRCDNCRRSVPKDKAIRRFVVRNIVESAARRDMAEASVYDNYQVPKMYFTLCYCVSCAVHARIVRARPAPLRRNRAPPARFNRPRTEQEKPKPGAPGAAAPGAPAAAPATA
jgi:small subunit ribosomal protein S26e